MLVVFVCAALLSFVLTIVILRRRSREQSAETQKKGGYELVNGQKTADNALSTGKELKN